MNEEEKLEYFKDIYKRRALAHKRSLE